MNHQVIIYFFGFIIVSNLNCIRGQSEVLSCIYSSSLYGYSCGLTIINPNGFNNFTGINGTHLAGMTDDDVRYIYGATGSNATNIPSIICDKFRYTQRIEILARNVQIIHENSFQNCKNLTFLDLKNNKIREFHENAFKENSELQQLLLWFNEITDLPEDPFTNLQKLVRLDFESNKIIKVPKHIFKPLLGLNQLFLEKNYIEELPVDALTALQNMTLFWIYSNKLKVIRADSFGYLPKLKTVQMYSNQIDAIDERFINNTGVNRLDVRFNLCVNKDISDTTVSREAMRNDLRQCFDNYKKLEPECAEGDLDKRVCNLEINHEQVIEDIEVLKKKNLAFSEENERMRSELENLAREKQELEEYVMNQGKNFATVISNLESRLLRLEGCVSGC